MSNGYYSTNHLSPCRIPAHLRSKIGESDITQEAMLNLHRARGRIAGLDERDRKSYVQATLRKTWADQIRRFDRSKRRASRERSLQSSQGDSSARLPSWLTADQTSLSERDSRSEQLSRLAEAMASLSDSQRRAVQLRHLQGCTLDEIARDMQTSYSSAAGYLRRGLEQLRKDLLRENP